MSWDTPTSGQPDHYFLELNNETTGQVFSWNNLAGSSNSTSKFKYGQRSGDQFKWRIRELVERMVHRGLHLLQAMSTTH